MEIDGIFVVVDKSLVAVKYTDSNVDEFERLFDNWTDVEYLYNFFSENIDDLVNGFYGTMTVEVAIEKTIEDAEELEQKLLDIAELGQEEFEDNLQTLFKPLDNNEYRLKDLQESKAYGNLYKSWLRIYAIRIAKNTYVVSGGAIKLTPTMNERAHLLLELKKLNLTKAFLIDNGLIDEDDFDVFVLN